MRNSDIIQAIEKVADPSWQEDFDNSGLQLGNPGDICSGVLLCVDVTREVVAEAIRLKCNLIISHHPLLFRGVKTITPDKGRVEQMIIELITNGITLYSAHTSLDSAPRPYSVSYVMAEEIGLIDIEPLTSEPGLGAIGILPEPMPLGDFARQVKTSLEAGAVRLSRPVESLGQPVSKVALCAGAGIEFIDDAIKKGADVFVCSDVKLNWFLDRRDLINLIEVGHFEAEKCTKKIFRRILFEAGLNIPVYLSKAEKNPTIYI